MQPPGGVDTRRETRIICYLAAVSISYLSVFFFLCNKFSFFLASHSLFLVLNSFPPKGDPGHPCPCGGHRGAHHDGCSSWDGLHQLLVTNQRWRNQRNPRASEWKTTKQDQTKPKKPQGIKMEVDTLSLIAWNHGIVNVLAHCNVLKVFWSKCILCRWRRRCLFPSAVWHTTTTTRDRVPVSRDLPSK